jgi:DinB family protein
MPHQRPRPDEYSPHYERYISLISGPVLSVLDEQRRTLPELLRGLSEEDAGYRYADGKWSIREVVGHISDAERIYQFRALVFARGDATALSRYDPDGYVEHAGFEERTLSSIIDEFLVVRAGTLNFFHNLATPAWSRDGTVSGGRISVRALAWIAAGHLQQHVNVLTERYGVREPASATVAVA